MSAGKSFIDINVRRGPPFRKAETTERLHLPITWQANQRRWQIFMMPLFLSLFLLFGAGLIYNGWIITGILSIIYFGFVTYMILRMKLGLWEIGPGQVTIDENGFTDERLGTARMLWRDMRLILVHHSRRDGPPVGISLLLDYEVPMTGAPIGYVAFRRAYFLLGMKTKRSVYIDFRGTKNCVQIEKAIRALIDAAKPR